MDHDRPGARPPVPGQRASTGPPPAVHQPVASMVAAAAGRPTAARPPRQRLLPGRPAYFPTIFAWLSVGISRNWRGVVGALICTWFYVPFAVVMSVICALVLGAVGFFGGFLFSHGQVPAAIAGLPVLGPAIDAFLPVSGGVLGGLVGVVLGLVLGFVGALSMFWVFAFGNDPLAGLGLLLGVILTALVVGLGYTLYRVIFEPAILRISGARRLSRREQALILPIVAECARRLGLANHPPILIDDRREPNAFAFTRHIVINQGMLEEFQYDPAVLAGVLSHELVHWRNGDPVSAAFVRGVAFPLYLVYTGAHWLIDQFKSSFTKLGTYLITWPVVLTVDIFLMPLLAADSRRAEYRADQGAALAGHRAGMRRLLSRLRISFEAGRGGWDRAVCATHPPNELRLERLEEPGRDYPLPDPEGVGVALPVSAGSSLRQD